MVRQQALSPLSHHLGPLPVVVYAHVYLWKEPQVEMGDLDLGLGALLWPRSSTKSPIDPRVSSTECRSLYFSPLPLSEFPETQMRLKARKRLLRFRLCKNNRAKEDGKELKEWRDNGRDGNGYHPNGSWRAEGSHDRAADSTRESGSGCHLMKAEMHTSGRTVCPSPGAKWHFPSPVNRGLKALGNISARTSGNRCIF